MDFKGQKLAERIYQILIVIFSIIAFFAGWVEEDYGLSVKIWAFGVVTSCIVVLPEWSQFNQNPVSWRGFAATEDTSKKKKK